MGHPVLHKRTEGIYAQQFVILFILFFACWRIDKTSQRLCQMNVAWTLTRCYFSVCTTIASLLTKWQCEYLHWIVSDPFGMTICKILIKSCRESVMFAMSFGMFMSLFAKQHLPLMISCEVLVILDANNEVIKIWLILRCRIWQHLLIVRLVWGNHLTDLLAFSEMMTF